MAGLARSAGRIFQRSHKTMAAGLRARPGTVRAKPGTIAAAPPATWLTGDPSETARVKEILIASGKRTLAGSPETAEELLFCQGNDFGFRDCIAGLEAAAPYRHGQQVKFVAAGSNSASGSTDRDGRGETLVF
jgi:hypothetical protein